MSPHYYHLVVFNIFLHELENNTSAANQLYETTNNRIEKYTIWTHRIFMSLTACFAISSIAVSMIKYISAGYSNDSFQQIYPAT